MSGVTFFQTPPASFPPPTPSWYFFFSLGRINHYRFDLSIYLSLAGGLNQLVFTSNLSYILHFLHFGYYPKCKKRASHWDPFYLTKIWPFDVYFNLFSLYCLFCLYTLTCGKIILLLLFHKLHKLLSLHLKSLGACHCAGSSPAPGINDLKGLAGMS